MDLRTNIQSFGKPCQENQKNSEQRFKNFGQKNVKAALSSDREKKDEQQSTK